jgi:putative component of toxin-antitoxin plasmid stabilization module
MLRVFFCTAGRKIILLLSGYDKARDPSARRQEREIARARKLVTAYRESQRRAGKQRS